MSSVSTQETIDQLQRDADVFRNQIAQLQQSGDSNKDALITSHESKISEKMGEVQRLQSQLTGELKAEAEQQAEEARKEQEKKDNGGLGGLL